MTWYEKDANTIGGYYRNQLDKAVELAKEAEVVLKIKTKVADLILQHCHSLDTHSQSKTAILIGIYVTCFEDVGVNHPTT